MKGRILFLGWMVAAVPGLKAEDQWQELGSLAGERDDDLRMTALVIDPVHGRLFAGTFNGGLFVRSEPTSNSPPIANDLAVDTLAQTPLSIDVLAQVVAPPGSLDPLSVSIVQLPAHGIAAPQPDGSLIYLSEPGFVGDDEFTFTVANLSGQVSNAATVTVDVLQQQLAFEPETLDFGQWPAGSPTPPAALSVINASGRPATLGSVYIDDQAGVFEVTQNDCDGQHVQAGADCQLLLRFRPLNTQPYLTTLGFPGSTDTATLIGTGVDESEDAIFRSGFE